MLNGGNIRGGASYLSEVSTRVVLGAVGYTQGRMRTVYSALSGGNTGSGTSNKYDVSSRATNVTSS